MESTETPGKTAVHRERLLMECKWSAACANRELPATGYRGSESGLHTRRIPSHSRTFGSLPHSSAIPATVRFASPTFALCAELHPRHDNGPRGKRPANTTEGRILPVLANAIAAFLHSPEWGGVLAFNEFGCGTVVLKPAPWGVVPKGEWTDHEDRLAAEWLQRQGILVSVNCRGASGADRRERSWVPSGEDIPAGPSMGRSQPPGPMAIHLSGHRRQRILARRRLALAHLCRRTHIPARREGRLLPDPGRTARHPKIDRTANRRWRAFHR